MAIDMTKGAPLKMIAHFAFPMLLGAIFQQLYTVVDMVVVGNAVGSRALAAVGAAGTTTFLATAVVTGLTTGFIAVGARFFGAKDGPMLRKTLCGAIYISAACAVVLSVAGLLGAGPLMRLLRTPDEIIEDATLYLRIYIGGSVGMVLLNSACAVMRAVGDSRTPLVFLVATSILSVLLDLLFVLVFHMGVAGVATANVIAQALSAAACIIYMYKRFEMFRLTRSELAPPLREMGLILKIGLPVCLQSILLSIGDMTVTGVVNSFGTNVTTAYAVCNRVMGFTMMLSMQLAQAFAVFAGQNLGAKETGRIRRGFRDSLMITVTLSLCMTGVVMLFGDSFTRLFISDTDAHIETFVSITRYCLRVTASFYVFLGAIWLYNFTLRGIGDVVVPFLSGVTELVVKIGLSIAFSRLFGFAGIWFAVPLGWMLGLIPSAIRFHTGGWKKLSAGFSEVPSE